jgi:C-terminal processing protease CtpA/Prc
LLEGNVGYVDLRRLEPGELDSMFEAMGKTKAVILDLRGYPRGVGPLLVPRLNARNAATGALFRRRFISAYDGGPNWLESAQEMSSGPSPYRGRVVTLVDGSTISQAEHTALLLEAATGTRFVGAQTAGADGDVTDLVLPGGVRVLFTGAEVRHADGRPLEGVGIVPEVKVEPTIEGLRAGRDEVLEASLRLARGERTGAREPAVSPSSADLGRE